MGKITEVMYKEVEPELCNSYRAGEYYFYFNMLGINDSLDNEYIKYEEEQVKLRNRMIHESMKDENKHPKLDKSIFGISTIKDKVVIISEY